MLTFVDTPWVLTTVTRMAMVGVMTHHTGITYWTALTVLMLFVVSFVYIFFAAMTSAVVHGTNREDDTRFILSAAAVECLLVITFIWAVGVVSS